MYSLRYYRDRLRGLSAPELIKKCEGRVRRRLAEDSARRHDLRSVTYATNVSDLRLARLVDVGQNASKPGWLEPVCAHYMAHYFDVLGSGWIDAGHGIGRPGFLGVRGDTASKVAVDRDGAWLEGRVTSPNLPVAQAVWSLVSEHYQPIDWQVDVRTGYRVAPNAWHKDVRRHFVGTGADIKVPWELARMHHLTHLGMLAVCEPSRANELGREYQNQVLDFVATNPPRFGVNWASPMDVAIRLVNVLVARDLFLSAGVRFNEDLESVLGRSTYDHGRHIFNNLEWVPSKRGNHYLSNLVGLLAASVWLKRCGEAGTWWLMARDAFLEEVALQFREDGGNFEGSTHYHALSSEMVIFGTALILGAEGPDAVPEWLEVRIQRMGALIGAMTKPSGDIVQIGDNDSGRFLKMSSVYERLVVSEVVECYENLDGYNGLHLDDDYWFERHLNHAHLSGAVAALFRDAGTAPDEAPDIEQAVIGSLCAAHGLRSDTAATPSERGEPCVGGDSEWCAIEELVAGLPPDTATETTYRADTDLTMGLSRFCFPDFGLFILRSSSLFMSVRCGGVSVDAPEGHFHNDQLSLELTLGGRDLVRDPGTYVYTPSIGIRNEYRSASAHFTPQLEGEEPASLDYHPFLLPMPDGAVCMYFGERGFAGYYDGYGRRIWRRVMIEGPTVTVTDWCEGQEAKISVMSEGVPFSPGYGWRERIEHP